MTEQNLATKPTKEGTDADLPAFLRRHGLSGAEVIRALSQLNVNTLYDLRVMMSKQVALDTALEALGPYPVAALALQDLRPEAVDNAIFFTEHAGAAAGAATLKEFLIDHDVASDGPDWDRLFVILRGAGVTSLASLGDLKERGAQDAKLTALTAKIKTWDAEAAARFAALAPAQIATAERGRATTISADLKSFLDQQGVPAEAEQELAALGITTLDKFKDAKEDTAPDGTLARLKRKLDDSGIAGASRRLDAIRPDDVDREITEKRSRAAATQSRRKSPDLDKVIEKVEALRERVDKSSRAEFESVRTEVDSQYRAAVAALKDVSLADMDRAGLAAAESKTKLSALLSKTLANATAARDALDAVDQTTLSIADLIERLDILCGFRIDVDGSRQLTNPLLALPAQPDRMKRGGGRKHNSTEHYEGSQTRSFATAEAQNSSSALAGAAQASGGTFVGSGVAAVSAVATYADAQRASAEAAQFKTASRAECGEIYLDYVPTQLLQFEKPDIRLSDDARSWLQDITTLPAESRSRLIQEFYDEFGSHFFLHNTLGGRYQYRAHGVSHSEAGKGLLVSAVSSTLQWAAGVSGSYAGLGGSAEASVSVRGQSGKASATGGRYSLDLEEAKVSVTIDAVGGTTSTEARDVWQRSLNFNSTWAVIDRNEPRGIWELVRLDPSLPGAVKDLAPLLEQVWVRDVFLPPVRKSQPALSAYLTKQPAIATGKALSDAIESFHGEPPLEILVVASTSRSTSHPEARASASRAGLKLIGGGAVVDYGTGPGALLTGSYPDGNAWVGSAKDHVTGQQSTVTAYGIYLDDPYDLWEVKQVLATTAQASSRPTAVAVLPDGFELTGGGGRLTWAGPGILLTACGPVPEGGNHRSWTVRGKDHLEADAGHATAWVFGIRPRNGVALKPPTIVDRFDQRNHAATSYDARSAGDVIVGGGAEVTWEGPEGGLLTAVGFSGDWRQQVWQAQAKDHLKYAELKLTMWVITRRGRPVAD